MPSIFTIFYLQSGNESDDSHPAQSQKHYPNTQILPRHQHQNFCACLQSSPQFQRNEIRSCNLERYGINLERQGGYQRSFVIELYYSIYLSYNMMKNVRTWFKCMSFISPYFKIKQAKSLEVHHVYDQMYYFCPDERRQIVTTFHLQLLQTEIKQFHDNQICLSLSHM